VRRRPSGPLECGTIFLDYDRQVIARDESLERNCSAFQALPKASSTSTRVLMTYIYIFTLRAQHFYLAGTAQMALFEVQSGEIYCYFDFPPKLYRDLLKAESKGKYFGTHTRDRFP
jgi:hypothetical protein